MHVYCKCKSPSFSLNWFQSEVRNCSCPGSPFIYKMQTSSGPTCARSTIVTETPHDNWHVLWRMVVLLPPCTLVGLVAFGYKYGLRSDLRAPNLKIFQGSMPTGPPSMCVLTHAPSSVPPPPISNTFRCHCIFGRHSTCNWADYVFRAFPCCMLVEKAKQRLVLWVTVLI